MVGSTIMAMALSSGRAKLISPMAIGGMPMPIAPLAMPATMKAPAITSICNKLMPRGSCGVRKDLFDEARIGFGDRAGDRPANQRERACVGQVGDRHCGRGIEFE